MFRRGKYPSRGGYDSLPALGEGGEMSHAEIAEGGKCVEDENVERGIGSSGLGGRVPPYGAARMVAQVSVARVDDNSV
mgnify:CR=1 FL=1